MRAGIADRDGGLFYVGIDWGRWLHLEAVCLMFLAMMVERKAAAATPEEERAKRPGLKIRVVASAVVFVYCDPVDAAGRRKRRRRSGVPGDGLANISHGAA